MKKVLGIVLTIVMLAVALVTFSACGKKKEEAKNPIIGSWKYDGIGDYTYTFNEDGTGTYDLGSGNVMEFTYETKDGKISILYKNNTVPFESEYKIDGDTLNVIDSVGRDTLYKKVK